MAEWRSDPGALAQRLFGDDVDPAIRPLVALNLFGSIAGGMLFSFLSLWALEELGATERQLGLTFGVAAATSVASGYLGGRLSDRIGRRPLLLAGAVGQATVALALVFAASSVAAGLAVIVATRITGSFAFAAGQAIVADLVPAERLERAYAAIRVAANLGVSIGPVLGGAMLLLGWNALLLGSFALFAVDVLLAWRYLPRTDTGYAAVDGAAAPWGAIVRDPAFLLLFAAGSLSWIVYLAWEFLLPISLTQSHGLAPSTWGFLLVINPILVTLFQLRLTRRVAHVGPATKLATAMLLMGVPFLLLGVSSAIPLIVVVIVVFVIGEMLWVPTSQSVIASLAPEGMRGAYIGGFGASWAVGNSAAPVLGLQARTSLGDTGMWAVIAAAGVAGALLYVAACRAPRLRGFGTTAQEAA